MPILGPSSSDSDFVEEEEKKKADLLTQLIRGGTEGLTSGLYKPMADAGEGGLPETLAHIAGLGLGLGFPVVGPARFAGLGVSQLAKIPKFASLLQKGVTPGEAAKNMAKFGWQTGKSFSVPGAAAALGTGALGQTMLQEQGDLWRGEPPSSFGSRLLNSTLAIAGGGLAGGLMSRGARRAAEAAATAEHIAATSGTTLVKDAAGAVDLAKQRLEQLKVDYGLGKIGSKKFEREKADQEARIRFLMREAGMTVPPEIKETKRSLAKARKEQEEINEFEGKLGFGKPEAEVQKEILDFDTMMGYERAPYNEQKSLFPFLKENPKLTPPPMGPLTAEQRAAGMSLSPEQLSLLFGVSGEAPNRGARVVSNVDEPMQRALLDRVRTPVSPPRLPLPDVPTSTSELLGVAQRAVTMPGSETSQLLEAAKASQNIAPPRFTKSAEDLVREQAVASNKILPSPEAVPESTLGVGQVFNKLWRPPLPPPESAATLGVKAVREKLWGPGAISPGQIVGAVALPAAVSFIPEDLYGGNEELGQYGGVGLATAAILSGFGRKSPRRAGTVARSLNNVPLSNPGQHSVSDLYPLKATGYANAVRLGEKNIRFGYVVQPSYLYAGIPGLEELPMVKDMAMAKAVMIQNSMREAFSDIFSLPAETKEQARKIFLDYSKATPEAFEAKIAQDLPEALPAIQKYQDIMKRIYYEYVAEGVLKPGQRITNYFPDVRESLGVFPKGEMHVEYGIREYIPIEIEDLIRTHIPIFAKSRTLDIEKDFTRIKTFDQMLEMYIAQYARFKAIREAIPEIEQRVKDVPDYLQLRVADDLNAFFGFKDPAKRIGEFWSTVLSGAREYQFARTIGHNALSPIMNYFQKLNTFAVVGPSAFFQALQDTSDPARLAIARQAGLLDSVHKDQIVKELGISPSVPQWWSTIRGGKWFQRVEGDNQLHAFMAGLRKAEQVGVTDQSDQTKFAWRIMNDTQFITSSGADQAPWMRNEALKTLGQFKSFQINQLRFMTRMVEQAMSGVASGDVDKFKEGVGPIIRYFGPIVALLGPTGLMPGDWTDEDAAKTIIGRAAYIPGILPLLGVSLQHQLGLGSVGIEDINSFMFYMPGPTVGFIQSLIGSATGTSAGRGADLSRVSQSLSPDEQMRMQVSLLPGGVQLNRMLQALRLVQSDGEFRKSLDWGEFIGVAPGSGDLLAEHAARSEQMLTQALGMPTIEKERERVRVSNQEKIMHQHDVAVKQASDYMNSGRIDKAREEMLKFVGMYKDDEFVGNIDPMSLLTKASIEAARKRHDLPPVKRRLAPKWARNWDSFISPPEHTFSEGG
mgnify:CR=1 FL=1